MLLGPTRGKSKQGWGERIQKMKHGLTESGAVDESMQTLETNDWPPPRRCPLITPASQSPLDNWEEGTEMKCVNPHKMDKAGLGRWA